MFEKQDTRRLNTAELILPTETDQAAVLPSVMPKSPLDWPVEMFTQALDRREVNRKALLKWIESNLKPRIDFGQIHVVGKNKCQYAKNGNPQECPNKYHWSKPSLWKPGAEKICGMLGLIPRFPNLAEYEKAVIGGSTLKMIILKCELHTGNGFVAAEGTGARTVDKQDYGDINKSLKMAEKSAHIDATLRVAGLSELFTQDIEDMITDKETFEDIQPGANNESHISASNRRPATDGHAGRQSNGPQRQPGDNGDSNAGDSNGAHRGGDDSRGNTDAQRITAKQHKYILSLCLEQGISKAQIKQHCLEAYGAVVNYLTRADASSLIEHLLSR